MILRGGFNVYPREVEEALYTHPAVVEAAVIGVPHDSHGEEVKAVVVPQEGVSGDDELRSTLAAYCRENLAGFKVPRSIDFVDELPKSTVGKILRKDVKKWYSESEA